METKKVEEINNFLQKQEEEYEQTEQQKKQKMSNFKDYYLNYFPFKEIFDWISAGHQPQDMVQKEISYIV